MKPGAVGARIRERREELGISLDRLYARISAVLPEPMSGSTEKLRRIEKGKQEPDAVYAAAVAKALGWTLYELSPELAEQAGTVRRMLDDDDL